MCAYVRNTKFNTKQSLRHHLSSFITEKEMTILIYTFIIRLVYCNSIYTWFKIRTLPLIFTFLFQGGKNVNAAYYFQLPLKFKRLKIIILFSNQSLDSHYTY